MPGRSSQLRRSRLPRPLAAASAADGVRLLWKEKAFRMEAPPLERRLVAILAADVEGYSRLMHGDEEATMATLSARRGLVDDLIARHRGRIANTAGDSVLAEFASVLDAVHCAVEMEGAIERANEGEPEDR